MNIPSTDGLTPKVDHFIGFCFANPPIFEESAVNCI